MSDRNCVPTQKHVDVFISYAREDRDRASTLATLLERRGWSLWWDHKIPLGRTYDEVIEEALDSARCVVVLWSSMAVTSKWVKAEARAGLERNVLVPVLLDQVRVPLEFRALEAAQLVAWRDDTGHPELVKLVERIGEIVGVGSPPTAYVAPPELPGPPAMVHARRSVDLTTAEPKASMATYQLPRAEPLPQAVADLGPHGSATAFDPDWSSPFHAPANVAPVRVRAESAWSTALSFVRRFPVLSFMVAMASVLLLVAFLESTQNKTASAKISRLPADAVIAIDGKPAAISQSGEIENIAPGLHTIEASKKGFQSITEQVLFVGGEKVSRSFSLDPNFEDATWNPKPLPPVDHPADSESRPRDENPSPGDPSKAGPVRKHGRAPDVIPGQANVRGSLDKETIRRIIRRHINEVKYCYETELVKKANLSGRVSVQFTIAATGQVIASVLQSSTLGNIRVENCVVQAVRRWEFPKPMGGGIVIVSYPFNFTSGDGGQ